MSLQVTNPYPDIIATRLSAMGVTGEAANWVVKALHPAGPACPDGIPDADTTATLRPEYRLSKVISKPAALPGGDWDLILIKHPTDATAFCWAAGPAGVDFTSSNAPGDGEQGIEFIQPFIPVGATNMTNVNGGESPIVAFDMVQPDSLPAAWRHSSSSITAYMTASELYNQGTVFAGQYGHSVQNDVMQYRPFTGVGVPGVTQFLQRSASGSAPYSEALMTLTTPKLRTAPAKEGAYIPLRLNGPAQPLVEPNHMGSEILVLSGSQVYAPFATQVAFTPVHVRDYTNRTDANAYGQSWVYGSIGSATDNMATGIILFRGLHSAASITVKTYDQLEIRPRFDSPSRSLWFQQPSTTRMQSKRTSC